MILHASGVRVSRVKCWILAAIMSENVGIDQGTDKRSLVGSEFVWRSQCANLTLCVTASSSNHERHRWYRD